MRTKRVVFRGWALPLALVAPQLAVTLVFFIWPAAQALLTSVYREDAFGFSRQFVGFANFRQLFADPLYRNALEVTAVFSLGTAVLALLGALILAFMADCLARGARFYSTVLIWPYAIATAVAGVLWWFLFNPSIGLAAHALRALGYDWNHLLSSTDALVLVVTAAAWKQMPYNFLFFVAGMQAVPRALIEAAAMDGAGPVRRFFDLIFPLLGPTAFFLLVVNIVYAFFDTFAVVHATTQGGPGQATTILVYKVFRDGFLSLDLGASAAQSVVLMGVVIALTVVQFRFIERRVAY